MENLKEICKKVKKTTNYLNKMNQNTKNRVLELLSKNLIRYQDEIIKANEIDIEIAKKNNLKESLIDRLLLNKKRIKIIADSLLEIINLEDPIRRNYFW